MIVGNGLIAKEFLEYSNSKNILIFASGVSNSKEERVDEFLREENLLRKKLEENKNIKFIYFSTCSIYDNYFESSKYCQHKLKMENIIIKKSNNYNIFRVPQIVGFNNKNQLVGYLYNKIKNKDSFDLYDIERNLIDVSDMKNIVKNLIVDESYNNSIINIAYPSNIKVKTLVEQISIILNIEPKYNLITMPGDFNIDVEKINNIIEKLNICKENYVEKLLRKYYSE
ncbi:MAG: hypothetical protein ACNI25_09975 [Halarcobacter sp.]